MLKARNIAVHSADLTTIHQAYPGSSHGEAIHAALLASLGFVSLSQHPKAWETIPGRHKGIWSRPGLGRRTTKNTWIQITLKPDVWTLLQFFGELVASKIPGSETHERLSLAYALHILAKCVKNPAKRGWF